MACCLFLVGGLSYFYLKEVTDKYDHVVKINYGNHVALTATRGGAKDIRAIVFKLGLPATTLEQVSASQADFTKIVADRDKADKTYQDIPFVPGEQELYDAQIAKWKPFVALTEKLIGMAKNRTQADLDEYAKITFTEFEPAAVDLGRQTVNQMIEAVNEIHTNNVEVTNQMTHIQQEVSNILQVISEIGNKTKVINDIVFQTKLLSFNASVEAARAGEHGKGFAVVAEEVGNLAQMSGNASKEISQMLEGSMQQVNRIVDETKIKVDRLIQSGREKVETGTTTAQRCGEVLNDVVKNVAQVGQMVEEITHACQEQAHGIQEINKAMNQLDHATQKNAHACTESSQAADHLDGQAQMLREAVASLFATVQGHHYQQAEGQTSARKAAPHPERPIAKAA